MSKTTLPKIIRILKSLLLVLIGYSAENLSDVVGAGDIIAKL